MAAYAAEVDIRCDGCNERLTEDTEVFCSDCRTGLSLENVRVLQEIRSTLAAIQSELIDTRAALDAIIDSSLIAPAHVRDQLRAISARIGNAAK